MRVLFMMFVLVMAGCTCGSERGGGAPLHRGELPAPEESPRAPEGALDVEHSAGGLTWRAEEPLVARAPSSSMRAAEYGVRDFSDAELTVFHFGRDQGGDVDGNIERWVGQFVQDDGRPSRDVARTERLEILGMPVTTVEVSGSFSGMNAMGGTTAPRSEFGLLGAIVQGPEGMVFFKLTGPKAAIDAAENAFRGLIQSVHPR